MAFYRCGQSGGTPDTLTLTSGTKWSSGEKRTITVEVGALYIIAYGRSTLKITSGAEILSTTSGSFCTLRLVRATSTSMVITQDSSTYTAYGVANVSKIS